MEHVDDVGLRSQLSSSPSLIHLRRTVFPLLRLVVNSGRAGKPLDCMFLSRASTLVCPFFGREVGLLQFTVVAPPVPSQRSHIGAAELEQQGRGDAFGKKMSFFGKKVHSFALVVRQVSFIAM